MKDSMPIQILGKQAEWGIWVRSIEKEEEPWKKLRKPIFKSMKNNLLF